MPSYIWSSLAVVQLLALSVCQRCQGNLSIGEYISHGISTTANVHCDKCGLVSILELNGKLKRGQPNKLNLQAVRGAMNCGGGYKSLKSIFTHMGIKPMVENTFINLAKTISIQSIEITEKLFKTVAAIIRKVYMDKDDTIAEGDVIDISVSYDCSWPKKGAMYGVGTIVEMETGLVLDYDTKSKYCKNNKKNPMKVDQAEHVAHEKCTENYSGTSAAMDIAAAETLFGRSIVKYGFRYTTVMLSGDKTIFERISRLNTYGSRYPIQRERCVNIIHRRMLTVFRKLIRSECSSIGLQMEVAELLSDDFSNAICNNKNDVNAMNKAIWQSFEHVTGDTKWYLDKIDRDGATSTTSQPQLSQELTLRIKPIYERFTETQLLSRCKRASSQNCNQPFHNCMWVRCPKNVFYGLHVVRYAISTAAFTFNYGARSSFESLDVYLQSGLSQYDSKRIREENTEPCSSLDDGKKIKMDME